MFIIPQEFSRQISAFAPLFTSKVFKHVKILLIGSLLATGRRTICSVLRVVGLEHEKQFHKYHRVLSKAKWSCHQAARILLQLLINTFVPATEPLVFGIDETLERRWGNKIKARGIYRDAVRSTHSYFVKCSGLRWISLMLLTPVSWASRVWALPFLTVLAPSQRYYRQKGKTEKKLTRWAQQMI
jgi:DDE superfamily endonuclease